MDSSSAAVSRSRDEVRRDLRARFEAQCTAFRTNPPEYDERMDALRRLECALVKRKADIARAISKDFGGRAIEETTALEIFPVLNEIRHAMRHLRRWMMARHAAVPWQFLPARARVIYQPLGVIAILAPWNYPVFLTFGPLVGAVAAGNHAMLKPSELTPETSELLGEMVGELYPPEYVTVVSGGPEIASEFTALPFDHILFTGSTRVGQLVMKAASENLASVTLELGGKSPAIVHPEYPMARAVERILTGKLYNAGQTCVAPDYALIEERQVDKFLTLAQQIVPKMYPKLVDNPDYTRIVNIAHYRRLAGIVEDAAAGRGRTIEINPASEDCNETNRVFPPTLVANTSAAMRAESEEIFGPVLPVIPYSTLGKAVDYVNARPHPLAVYYFDENIHRAGRVAREIAGGGVAINDCMFHLGVPGLPFGGLGPSGMGEYHGFHGFARFSKKKGIFIQGQWSPQAMFRPPYSDRARRILDFFIGS